MRATKITIFVESLVCVTKPACNTAGFVILEKAKKVS